MNLLLPVDGSIEPLDDAAPDVLSSRREPAGESSEDFLEDCVSFGGSTVLPAVVCC